MIMSEHQIFNDTFERSWRDFDEMFRRELLAEIRQLGSIHRLSGDHKEINSEYSRRFYSALERAIVGSDLIQKLKSALVITLPSNFDELEAVFDLHPVYQLHAFYLLLLYVHEYPLRAFFSGRDRSLPLNTLKLKFHQTLGDPLPTAVDYELDYASPEEWQRLSEEQGSASGEEAPLPNRQHYWRDLYWVWHF
jgi:hypothetical protein